jgi:Na+/H+ antiporter NhaA
LERRAGSGRSSACRSLREFLDTEVAGGLVLLAATVLALVWANSPWASVYEAVWDTELAVEVGRWTLALDLRHWVNDGLMALGRSAHRVDRARRPGRRSCPA